ncbi:MAG TPA: ribonuclease J [Candidatus Angelobacter sp.]|nr:ribonuclease J [Candidatus Angelobacter sp.]
MTYAHPQLGVPPELPRNALRVVPLGGLGDIGRNMTVFEHASRLLVVDCGVLFPEDAQPGVDLILPDFDLIRNRLAAVEAIVLTHAHEDHIGAVPYLLRERQDIPVYGSRLTLALLEAKLKEHRIKATTIEVVEGETATVGPFELEFVAVNHSIPDAFAVFIATPAGTVLHTGDFKMDQLPLDGRITDLRSFARLGERGVDLFLVDSTNAEVPGFVASERELEPALDRVFTNAKGRIVVASFASHVHRIQQIIDVAHRHHRKIAFFGRSMVRNMGVASDLGYLTIPGGVLVASDQLTDLPDDQVVLICTGSQGEPMAALSRIANNDHQIKVGVGDTVVLASSLIPGNENAVSRVINGLTRLGAKVVHKGNAMVHVSGHAAAGELLYCYNIVKPRNVMPVHGEPRHLKANAELALATGIPAERILLTLDGGVVDLVDGRATVVGAVPCGYVYVDGASVGDLTETSLKDRRVLGTEGFVTCFVVVDSVDGKVTAGPEIQARGFVEDDAAFDDVLPMIKAAVEDALRQGTSDQFALQQVVRRVLGRWVNAQHRRKPMIVPVVVEA